MVATLGAAAPAPAQQPAATGAAPAAYSLNNITAQKSADGSVDIQFGGGDGKIPNCLPTVPGWN